MKNKIIQTGILMLVLTFFISSAQAITYENGSLEIQGTSSATDEMHIYSHDVVISDEVQTMRLFYKNELESGLPSTLIYEDVRMTYINSFSDLPQNVGGSFQLYIGDEFKGSGTLMIRKTAEISGSIATADFYYYFDENFIPIDSTVYNLKVYSHIISDHYSHVGCYYVYGGANPHEYTDLNIGIAPETLGSNMYSHGPISNGKYCTYERFVSFKNEYSISFDYSVCNISISRDYTGYDNKSKMIIYDSNNEIYYESEYDTTNTSTKSFINDSYNFYIKPFNFNENYLIHTTIVIPTYLDASLSFDETSYNIGDDMVITYMNLQALDTADYTYDLQFYYYINQNEIEFVYNQPLRGSLDNFNDIAYINTIGWTPKKLYAGVVSTSVNYKNSKETFLANVKLIQQINLTYPYEYVYDTCNGDYCQYQNGDTLTIVYNSYTNQTINVSDDTGIIQSLGNVKGFGEIEFTIPFDNNKQYEYPQWNITMGDNYDHITVYWIEQSEYEEYYQEDIDQEVTENVNELKDGLLPVKDLLIGLTTIVIDNPDYDNNGIVESGEIDQWFNSVIGVLLIVVIYIFYTGLKGERR